MGREIAPTAFAYWLDSELERQGVGVRTLARRIIAADGDEFSRDLETVRRALNKYLTNGTLPSEFTRRAIAAALDVPFDETPGDADEEMARAVADAATRVYRASFASPGAATKQKVGVE